MKRYWAVSLVVVLLSAVPSFAQSDLVPVLNSMSLTSGIQGATVSVTLFGSNFVSAVTTVTVSGTGVIATGVRVNSPQSLTTLLILTGEPGQREIRAVNPGGASSWLVFTVKPSPFATAAEYETSTILGSTGGPGRTDGRGMAARFYSPAGLWGDGQNLYISDGGNGTIRRLDLASGAVTTLAGTAGVSGATDDFGAAASFGLIEGIWGDRGNLYVADLGNGTLRK